MRSEDIEIATPDGPMGAHVVVPDDGDGRAVVVVMEAFGVNDHIRDICRRYAAQGYVALAPDLYHRRGPFLTGAYTDLPSVMGHFNTLSTEQLAGDTAAVFAAVRARDDVDADRVVVTGFCLGGYVSFLAATREQPAAVAGFYGAGIANRREGVPIDPLIGDADEIRCPTLLFYGSEDASIPEEEREAVEKGLTAAGVPHELVVYEGAGHGFFCDARAAHVPDAAADAWARTLAWFDRALGAPAS